MLHVAAAIISNEEGSLLIARRKPNKAQGGMWEFPGGKLEHGETAAECLRRELLEEMNIDIAPYAWFGENEHDYGTVKIRLTAMRATYESGTITLNDHDTYSWASLDELDNYSWAPADVPFVRRLQEGKAREEGRIDKN